MTRLASILALFLLLTACTPASAGELGVDGYRCKVLWVHDGDTIRCGSGKLGHEKIRLIGVFAPEFKTCGGELARKELLRLVPVDTWVTLKFDKQLRDKYDRILAYVYTDDGTLVNLEMVRSGWAETTNKWPFKMYPEFAEAEREAMSELRGIWPMEVCVTASGKGKKYHPCGCFHLSRSKKILTLTRAAAKQQGFTPCSEFF